MLARPGRKSLNDAKAAPARFKNMKVLLAFDNDGVLRDESRSYQRCVTETVSFFSNGRPATPEELRESMAQSNNDWERTHGILGRRGVHVGFERVKRHFQSLYLGKERDFSGYINCEPWLADNRLLVKLAETRRLAIVSGAPKKEILYTLEKNGASDYFSFIWGMRKDKGKVDGLERAIARFRPERICFCDDRPSPIKSVLGLKLKNLVAYGIIPPQENSGWRKTLKDAGAREVFSDVKEYSRFLLDFY
jgi:phosphoglycolate phosphatase-like HAD superfamily hydrolase